MTVTAIPTVPRVSLPRLSREAWVMRAGIILLVAWLFLSIALPLWALLSKSFQNSNGEFVWLANYVRYFSTPSLFNSIFNSVGVAVVTTVIVIPLAFVYAYALTRSRMRFRGLIYAAFVVFTLVVTDFGIAKVIGGQFNVLATDAYKQVVGQQNFEMGAVVGMVLLAPAVLAFVIDRMVQRRQVALLSARAVPLEPKHNRARDIALMVYCLVIGGILVGVLGTAVWASFITYWPYNLTPTLKNYDFANFDPGGWSPYFTSVAMAVCAAVFGTGIVFTGAYFVEKTKVMPGGRMIAHLLAMLPMAVPGLVLGLGYVFFVNAKWNPLGFLYGTLAVLVINSVAHFYTVAHITSLTALKQIDPEFESVSASLKVPFWRTFARVTVPICWPSILDVAVYIFVNALTTVSAGIFLYGPDTKLASIAIVHMDEMGASAAAAGMATMIVATALGAKLFQVVLDRLLFKRLQAWRRR